MPPLFPEWSDSLLRLAMAGLALGVVGGPLLGMAWVRSSTATGQAELVSQPVKFDHRHHVRDDGIDCLYCHIDATRSAYAGVPATSVCMGCHGQVWANSPELALVRESFFEGKPIAWRRVDNLPDHVFFNHAIHLAKGVGCITCHGRVDRMASVVQAESLLMDFCLDCHRHPEPHLRPRAELTNMDWVPPRSQDETGRELAQKYDVHPTTDCTGCHR